MNISRPRPSILSLFDPLSATPEPSTPPRNSESPNLDSDKENEDPPRNELTLTTFFNRTYKVQHPSPKRLTRRLVDVGDVTVDNIAAPLWSTEEDSDEEEFNKALAGMEDNENDTLTFRQMAEAATPKWTTPKASHHGVASPVTSPSHPRTPLADLPLEQEATPIFRNKVLKGQLSVPSKLAQVVSPQIVITEPDVVEDEPKAETVQSPPLQENLSPPAPCASLGNSASSLNISNLPAGDVSLIDEAASPSLFSLSISSDASGPASTSLDLSMLRPNPPNTSSADSSRHSIDLQASFQLHMDSEVTFDLLNDKISFFDTDKNGLECSIPDFGEGSFDLDFEEARLDALASTTDKEETRDETRMIREPSPSDCEDMESGVVEQAKGTLFGLPDEYSPETPTEGSFPRYDGFKHSADVFNTGTPKLSLNKARASKLQTPSPPRTSEPSTPGIATPRNIRSIPVPPPVAGLRIVKRSKLALQKTNEAIAKSIEAVVPKKEKTSPPIASASRRPSLSQPMTQPGSATSTLKAVRPSTSRIDIARSNPAPVTRRPLGSDGPRRVLVDDQQRPPAAAPRANSGRAVPSSTVATGGPRRVPIAGSTMGTSARGSSLRQVAAPATSLPRPASKATGASSIPLPSGRSGISRLPAPSVVVRPTAPPAREGVKGVPIRRVI